MRRQRRRRDFDIVGIFMYLCRAFHPFLKNARDELPPSSSTALKEECVVPDEALAVTSLEQTGVSMHYGCDTEQPNRELAGPHPPCPVLY